MSLSKQLKEYIQAAFTGLWIQTHEPDEAEHEIQRLASDEKWACETWDVTKGDPVEPLKAHTRIVKDGDSVTCLLILHNYHRFFTSPLVIQSLANKLIEGKADRLFVIVLSPIVQLTPELEKLFVVIEHDLPDEATLTQIGVELTEGGVMNGLSTSVQAAAGLTRHEAEGAFALSLTRHGKLEPETVWEIKASLLKKSGLMELHRGKEKFDDLGGLQALKSFCRAALAPQTSARPRGVMLLGVPGTGKSAFAKALGNETARPTLVLDVGSLLGSLVGQSESNIRNALRIADAMAPCILFIDEIEKALAGHGSNGDSGVSTRLFGTLLSWLNDHTSDVFVVATSNDVSKLPPEFARAERWDGVFFLDLPTQKERNEIWKKYNAEFLDDACEAQTDRGIGFPDDNWTGAEIKSCCRLAALLGWRITVAAQNVIPVAVTAPEKVAALREWASGRCLSASEHGIFQLKKPSVSRPRRNVKGSSDNN